MHIFKQCIHVFCKNCLKQDVTFSIQSGELQKVRCPAMIGLKRCITYVTEKDLTEIGVENDLIIKMTGFSIGQAVDSMEDFGWCPNIECQAPAEVDKVKMYGQCTICCFQFCTSCKKKFHPFKRCETTMVAEGAALTQERMTNL